MSVAVLSRCLLLCWLAIGAAWAADELVPVPALSARVTDLTGTLSAQQKADLEQRLAAFEQERGSQIAILLVPTTRPEEIEQYSIRVAEAWKIGRKGQDDGIIIVVAKEDRALRIEVGYGLEGAIPDAIAKRIIAEVITPRFREGDFHGGLAAAVEQIQRLIAGESLPPPKGGAGAGGDGNNVFTLVLVLAVVLGGILRAMLGRFLGAGLTGGVVGFAAWLLAGSLFIGIIAAVVAFIFVLAMGSGGGLGGGWGGGHRGGGGFGGGWSGGGGGFGGGGASGRW